MNVTIKFYTTGKEKIALDEVRVSNESDILCYIHIWSRHLELQICSLVETTTLILF